MGLSPKLLEFINQNYTPESQFWMMLEEMGELIVAICKLHRISINPEVKASEIAKYSADVVTEIADVKAMSDQLAHMFGSDFVDREIKRKTRRLIKRLEERFGKEAVQGALKE